MHDNDPDPKLLAYQYLQTLPQLAQGAGNTFWVIPSEVTSALRSVASAFGSGDTAPAGPAAREPRGNTRREPPAVPASRVPSVSAASAPALDPAGTAVAGSSPATADALSAMLSAAIPLGAVDPAVGAEASGPPQDGDPPSANGAETAG